jgi:cellulose biosynthesis protein BcsQ
MKTIAIFNHQGKVGKTSLVYHLTWMFDKAALIAAEYVIIPVVADWFSLQALSDLGHKIEDWREGWAQRLQKNTET